MFAITIHIRLFVIILILCELKLIESKSIILSKTDDDHTHKITMCRAECLFKFLNKPQKDRSISEQCTSIPDCYMCWDYCRILIVAQKSLSNSICADQIYCTDGCIVACKYHSIESLNQIRLNDHDDNGDLITDNSV